MSHVWRIVGKTDTCEKCGALQEWNKERTAVKVFKPGIKDCGRQEIIRAGRPNIQIKEKRAIKKG